MQRCSTGRLLLYLLISGLITLQGCSAKEQSMQGMKVGLHIDAVLEFVTEYPLDWSKDRRVVYGTNDGEVRWTYPDDAKIMLRVLSYERPAEISSPAQRLTRELPDYPGQNILVSEKELLPAGEAVHLTAQTPKADVEAYQLTTTSRNYTIALIVPRETLAEYKVMMSEIIQSFNFVE
ncbi:MAG: hypothetical protein GWN13_03555 [Phycisphaerae bacterium]|nr:hypothetical protein [Phycisphaerae bacterium]NIW97317.1 hypothetical protein [Phycisphaerae bacterium]